MKTVYAYVVADILHQGHIRHLTRARHLGNFLIVGVLTTMAVKERKSVPVQNGYARMELIRALRCVDSVRWQHEYSPLENIKLLKPDILAESTEHMDNDYLDQVCKCVEAYGGKVVFLPYMQGISTTKIKERIIDGAKKGLNRKVC